MPTKMPRIVYHDDDQWVERLRAVAAERDVPISAMVKAAVHQMIERAETDPAYLAHPKPRIEDIEPDDSVTSMTRRMGSRSKRWNRRWL